METKGELEVFDNSNRLRMSVYGVFKEGFSYPTAESYGFLESTPLGVFEGSDFAFLKELPPLSDLQVLYTSYFDVSYGGRGCHLRESEYLKNRQATAGLLLECKGFYKNFGLYLQPNELPDSLDIELEFMYYLTYLLVRESESKERDWEKVRSVLVAQRDFLSRHLIGFVEKLKLCLQSHSELKFYFNMAASADSFLKSDIEFVEFFLDRWDEFHGV